MLVLKIHPAYKAEVFTIVTLEGPVDFEKGNGSISVNLISRRVAHCAFARVSQKLLFVGEETKAEVTYVQTLDVELFRQRCEVPCLAPVLSKLNRLHVFHHESLLKVDNLFFRVAQVRVVIPLSINVKSMLLLNGLCLNVSVLLQPNLIIIDVDLLLGDPPVDSLIFALLMDIILIHFLRWRNSRLYRIVLN